MALRVTDPTLIKASAFPNWQELTAQKPGLFPESMTGSLPGLIGKSAVGAGLGYLASYPLSWMNKDIDRKKAQKILPLVGAGAMAAWSLPQVMTDAPSVGWSHWKDQRNPAYEEAIKGQPAQEIGDHAVNNTWNTSQALRRISTPPPAPKFKISRGSADGTCSINDVYAGLEKLSGFFGSYNPPGPGQLGLPGSPVSYGGVSPYTPGMGVINSQEFGIGQAMNTVLTDTALSPVQRVLAIKTLREAAQNDETAAISTQDLIRGAVGAGVGYGTAAILGKTLGAVFGLPPRTQRKLSSIGAVGGLLNGLGILKY